MDDPVYITKGAIVGAFFTAGALALYDKFFPTPQHRVQRVKRNLKLSCVAMDVDPELVRAFINLQYYKNYNNQAYEDAFGRIDSVCMIYKLLVQDSNRQPQDFDYSVAWIHYKHAMTAFRSLYESVRATEIDLFNQRENAKARLKAGNENRRKARLRGDMGSRNANKVQAEERDQNTAAITLQCDTLQTLIALVRQQTEQKINYIKDRVDEYCNITPSTQQEIEEGEQEEEEEQEEEQGEEEQEEY